MDYKWILIRGILQGYASFLLGWISCPLPPHIPHNAFDNHWQSVKVHRKVNMNEFQFKAIIYCSASVRERSKSDTNTSRDSDTQCFASYNLIIKGQIELRSGKTLIWLVSVQFSSQWSSLLLSSFSGLSLFWSSASKRGFQLPDVVRLLSQKTAQLCCLDSRKGCLAPSYDADLVVWDPEREFEVRNHKQSSYPEAVVFHPLLCFTDSRRKHTS